MQGVKETYCATGMLWSIHLSVPINSVVCDKCTRHCFKCFDRGLARYARVQMPSAGKGSNGISLHYTIPCSLLKQYTVKNLVLRTTASRSNSINMKLALCSLMMVELLVGLHHR